MSLTDRLRRIEQRLDALERGQVQQAQAMDTLVSALEDEAAEPESTPGLSLDGEQLGGERDQSESLDG